MTAKLAGLYLDLVKPKMIARRWDVLFAFQAAMRAEDAGAQSRGLAGALGLCWPELLRHLPAYNGNLLMWSEHVTQYLVEHGAPIAEISVAAGQALDLCILDIPGGDAALGGPAADALGNSEALKEG